MLHRCQTHLPAGSASESRVLFSGHPTCHRIVPLSPTRGSALLLTPSLLGAPNRIRSLTDGPDMRGMHDGIVGLAVRYAPMARSGDGPMEEGAVFVVEK